MHAILLLAPLASAVDISPEGYRPPDTPAPSPSAARALVSDLLAGLDDADVGWLRERFRPVHLPGTPSDAWYAALAERLGPDAALGGVLRDATGPVATIPGPDYLRVVLDGRPTVSLVVREGPDGPVVHELTATTCVLCDEPARFVRDLLADISRRGSASGRLLPGVELDLEGAPSDPDWRALLQTRNHQGGELAALLSGAEVTGADGDRITVRYADGREDLWRVVYRDGTWRVHYASLQADSPLRLSRAEMDAWRSDRRLQATALDRWAPTWNTTPGGAGVEIGDRVTSAAFDPRDGTVLLVVADLDRVLAGVVRVDPMLRTVADRWPVPPPTTGTPLPFDGWFGRWRAALSPDASRLALTLPGRLWTLDVAQGSVDLFLRADDVTALAWSPDDTLHVATPGALTAWGPDGTSRRWLAAPALALSRGGALAACDDGTLAGADAPAACCGDARDAAFHPDGTELLVTCEPGCGVAAERIDLLSDRRRALAGTPGEGRAASWSPDGAWYTTHAADGAPGEVLLWRASDDRPIAAFGRGGVHRVAWAPDSARLVTLGTDGQAWLWDLHLLRKHHAL